MSASDERCDPVTMAGAGAGDNFGGLALTVSGSTAGAGSVEFLFRVVLDFSSSPGEAGLEVELRMEEFAGAGVVEVAGVVEIGGSVETVVLS
jgi:hypothetical protein